MRATTDPCNPWRPLISMQPVRRARNSRAERRPEATAYLNTVIGRACAQPNASSELPKFYGALQRSYVFVFSRPSCPSGMRVQAAPDRNSHFRRWKEVAVPVAASQFQHPKTPILSPYSCLFLLQVMELQGSTIVLLAQSCTRSNSNRCLIWFSLSPPICSAFVRFHSSMSYREVLEVTLGRMESLTAREIEVSRLIARGLSNKQIGEQLKISEQTVKNHTHTIYRKLTVSNRVELTIHVYGNYEKNLTAASAWPRHAKNGGRAGTGSARRHSV